MYKKYTKIVSAFLGIAMVLSLVTTSMAAISADTSSNDAAEQEGLINDAEVINDDSASPRARTKDNVVVIVPGIMGSELKVGSTLVWAPQATGLFSIAKLECSELGSSLNTITPYNGDNFGAIDTYKSLYGKLSQEFSAIADVKFYSYDWRLSCASNASGLKTLVDEYPGQIIIVAHSMGGLVGSQYLKNATANQRNRTTFITLGTPFTGAPKALQIMEDGDMDFGPVGDIVMSPQIKKYGNNFPAVYQLLPTSRSLPFLKMGSATSSYLSYTDALVQMKNLPWAKTTNGTAKPMFSTAQTFFSGIENNGSHYAYTAYRTYHIAANGNNTTNGVYYVLSNGEYKIGGYLYDGSGDGTVPLNSAWNKLSYNDSRLSTYSGVGNHTTMLTNSTVLTKIETLVKKTFIDTGTTKGVVVVEDNITTSPIEVNARGWIINQGLDGRRININVNFADNYELLMADGRNLVFDYDIIYCQNSDGSLVEIGNKWITGIGIQYALVDGDYIVDGIDGNEDSEVIISYMDNGYYDQYLEYSDLGDSGLSKITVRNYNSGTIKMFNSVSDSLIMPTHIYSESELQLANQD